METKTRSANDQKFMALAIAEAKKGQGRTSPNPCVGCVVVKNNKVIAEGYHKKAGTPHAEVHALQAAGDDALGGTLYVTLEPCCHTGKTPPCSQAVVKAGIKRVVIGMLDPNPLVDGGGRKYLVNNGVEVESGVMEEECRTLNEPFLKFITTGKPYVVLKAGLSLDGRLSYKRGESGWITGTLSAEKVHKLRNIYDGILVGRSTVEIDNPSLTTRLAGQEGRDPIRIVLDTALQTSPQAKVYNLDSKAPTLVFCSNEAEQKRINFFQETTAAEIVQVRCDKAGRVLLDDVLERLAERNITSILVEGGGGVHSSFIKEKHADKAILFLAPLLAGTEGRAFTPDLAVKNREDAIRLSNVRYTQLGEDMMIEGNFEYPADKF